MAAQSLDEVDVACWKTHRAALPRLGGKDAEVRVTRRNQVCGCF